MMDFVIGLMIAGSSGLGFDPGFGMEVGLESKHAEVMIHSTTEQKHNKREGFVYGGHALLMLPVSNVTFGVGVQHHGYEAESWGKSDTAPVAVVRVRCGGSGNGMLGFTYSPGRSHSGYVGVEVEWRAGSRSFLRLDGTSSLDGGKAAGVGWRWRL